MGATPRAIALTGASQAVCTSQGIYAGFTIRETGGSTAVVRLWDNPSAASGTVLEEISLASGESARECYPAGIRAALGVYVQVVSGAVAGSIRMA